MTDEIAELLDAEWHSVDDLCSSFDDGTWAIPAALPGWSVKDCLSHIAGVESSLLGEPMPAVDVSHLAHIVDPFQEITEAPVEFRRSWTGQQVLDDFRTITARRVDQLRAMTAAELDTVGWSPLGDVPYRVFMGVRLFDSWMHEQDMRRAADRPGHLHGVVVDRALDRFRAAVPFVIGKKAGAPEGSTVVIATTGDTELSWTIAVIDGRAKLTSESAGDRPPEPTVGITMPFTTLVALGGGRWNVGEARHAGPIELTGDDDLAERILANLAFTP
jgi:uncharacterized protein (TIGR03083 family)